MKENEDSIYFNRVNDPQAVIKLGGVRKSRWGRLESTIAIGKFVDDEPISTQSVNWQSYASFLKAIHGEGPHDLSVYFQQLPLSKELVERLENERNHKYQWLADTEDKTVEDVGV